MIEKPPPVLGDARVLEYAIVDESVKYSGHSSLFVGKPDEGLKELGPVPCLAIAQELESGEIMLLHCDEEWEVLGLGSNYDSVSEAKAKADRSYHGVTARWVETKVTEAEALKYRNEMWADDRCSFCEKIPPDFSMMIKQKDARICDVCIEEFHKMLHEDSDKS